MTVNAVIAWILVIAFCVALLAGCSTVPTFATCHEMHYNRVGQDITIDAKCKAPFGSSLGL